MLKSLNARTYSVSELTIIIRDMLENEFPNIAVEGEISNFRPSSTGHYYFSLKDKDQTFEIGSCMEINGTYYLIAGLLGSAFACTGYCVFTFVSDNPRGPFRADPIAFRLLGNSCRWIRMWARLTKI